VLGGARDEGRLFKIVLYSAIIKNEEQGEFGEVATAQSALDEYKRAREQRRKW
jgi:hypothetical protein